MIKKVRYSGFGLFFIYLVSSWVNHAQAEGYFKPKHPSPYADTDWSAQHANGRNSDSVNFAAPVELTPAWDALQDRSIAQAPTIGPNGLIYVTSGKGVGVSSLTALRSDGSIAWEAPPYMTPEDLDSSAVGGSAVIDRHGDIYLTDSNQIWAFHGDGRLKWVEALPAEARAALSLHFMDDSVVGVTITGKVIAYNRRNGHSTAPVLSLPVAFPVEEASGMSLPGLWGMDREVLLDAWRIFFGAGWPVSNTPAVHPAKPVMYIPAMTEQGAALFIVAYHRLRRRFEIKQSIYLGSGDVATSPALSPRGESIYVALNADTLGAFDEPTGRQRWQADFSSQLLASPSVGQDGHIYVGTQDGITAFDADGRRLWRQAFAQWESSVVDSVVTVATNAIYAVVMAGDNPYLVILDARDGRLMGEPMALRASSEAYVVLDRTGMVYISHLGWRTNRPGDGGISAFHPVWN